MVQVIKTVDRLLAERHGKVGYPIIHFQKPHGAPGERDSVCVYMSSEKREYLPYGIELERQIDDARYWVREGDGPVPAVVVDAGGQISIGRARRGQAALVAEVGPMRIAAPKVIDPR